MLGDFIRCGSDTTGLATGLSLVRVESNALRHPSSGRCFVSDVDKQRAQERCMGAV